MRRALLALLILLAACSPSWERTPTDWTPYDAKQDEWSARYRAELVERCKKEGHPVVSTDPVRCLGPGGEYVP